MWLKDMEPEIKNKIQKIVNVFESGTPNGDYGCISLYEDGPNGIKQITYGKSQTTEWGKLSELIKLYISLDGKFADQLIKYVDTIGRTSLVNDKDFISLLKEASKDPIMKESQDSFFDTHYWAPAKAWFDKNGFKSNLSMLVIYDSFIHSGSILKFLRERFVEKVPVNGGDEKAWIEQYSSARLNWLKNHSNPILRKTTYRVCDFLMAMDKNNWDLEQEFSANGTKIS
jgi:chitosanase